MTMGEYIKELRTKRGLSQEALGKIVGVERAAVQKWEKGSVENIKRSTIKKLADYFGVSPCELMKWDEDSVGRRDERQICDLMAKCYGTDVYITVSKLLRLDTKDRGYVEGVIDEKLKDDKYRQEMYASA